MPCRHACYAVGAAMCLRGFVRCYAHLQFGLTGSSAFRLRRCLATVALSLSDPTNRAPLVLHKRMNGALQIHTYEVSAANNYFTSAAFDPNGPRLDGNSQAARYWNVRARAPSPRAIRRGAAQHVAWVGAASTAAGLRAVAHRAARRGHQSGGHLRRVLSERHHLRSVQGAGAHPASTAATDAAAVGCADSHADDEADRLTAASRDAPSHTHSDGHAGRSAREHDRCSVLAVHCCCCCRRRTCTETGLATLHICTGAWLASLTSALGLG
jgi:hypothetical protein